MRRGRVGHGAGLWWAASGDVFSLGTLWPGEREATGPKVLFLVAGRPCRFRHLTWAGTVAGSPHRSSVVAAGCSSPRGARSPEPGEPPGALGPVGHRLAGSRYLGGEGEGLQPKPCSERAQQIFDEEVAHLIREAVRGRETRGRRIWSWTPPQGVAGQDLQPYRRRGFPVDGGE